MAGHGRSYFEAACQQLFLLCSTLPTLIDAPNVVGLVYIAAFALDQGESLGALLSQGPVTPALAHLFTDKRDLVGSQKMTLSTTLRPPGQAGMKWSRRRRVAGLCRPANGSERD
jgi:hypothetical protein